MGMVAGDRRSKNMAGTKGRNSMPRYDYARAGGTVHSDRGTHGDSAGHGRRDTGDRSGGATGETRTSRQRQERPGEEEEMLERRRNVPF